MPQASHEEQYVAKGAHLNSIPTEAFRISALKVLDLSSNEIASIPVGTFPKLHSLELCDLSRNRITELPDDIGALQSLQRLSVAHNKLTGLPDSLCQITTLSWLNIKSNSIQQLKGNIKLWKKLQVLNVSNNDLEFLPADVGWLPLTELHVSGNPKLRIPQIVLKQGFKAISSYLQVVCEQHRLVEQHLSRFTHPDLTGGDDAEHLIANGSPSNGLSVEQRISEAASTGILDLKGCASFDALKAAQQDLQAVYVADVRSSRCTSIDANLLSFDSLVILNASFNQIASVADGVAPASLGVLNVSFNKLKELPASLGESPVLQQMYLANNQITDLPASFADLPIVDLFLSENEFTHIPPAVLGMKQLAKLSIACCKLRKVAEELGNMASLLFLDISFNELQDLPESMSNLTSLNALNVSFNPLTSFPEAIANMTALLELNLDYTNVSNLPPEIGKLRHLEGLQIEGNHFEGSLRSLYLANPLLLVQIHNTALTSLDLSGTGLTSFPPQLASLTGLTALNLSHNNIPSFPPELGLLTNIKHLSVKENPLVLPFRQIAEVHGSRALINLYDTMTGQLDLSNCELGSLPQEVLLHGARLQQLKLANNRLTSLPMSMTSIEALNTLVLDYNALTTIPEVVFKLRQLTILMASCNQITSLPESIGSCSKLQAIVLQGNLISELPSSISCLVDLKALGVASNRLQGPLPEFLGACTALRLLDLSGNKITSFPASMGQMVKLKTLKALGNQLSSVPEQFRNLKNLQELQLEGNLFKVAATENGETVGLNAASPAAVKQVLDVLLPPPSAQPQEQQQQPALPPDALLPAPPPEPQLPQQHPQPPQQQQRQQQQEQAVQQPAQESVSLHQQQQQEQQEQAVQQHPLPPQQQQQQRQQQEQAVQQLAQEPMSLHQQQQEQQQQQAVQQTAQEQQSQQQGMTSPPPVNPHSLTNRDDDAQHLVAKIGRLSVGGRPPDAAKAAPEGPILTSESAEGEAAKRELQDQAAKARAQEKWLYLQKHAASVAQDPLRPRVASTWDSVPLKDISRLLEAISNPPPPPPLPNGNSLNFGPSLKRPQTMQRFRRMVDQSNMAVRLLGRVGSGAPGRVGSGACGLRGREPSTSSSMTHPAPLLQQQEPQQSL